MKKNNLRVISVILVLFLFSGCMNGHVDRGAYEKEDLDTEQGGSGKVNDTVGINPHSRFPYNKQRSTDEYPDLNVDMRNKLNRISNALVNFEETRKNDKSLTDNKMKTSYIEGLKSFLSEKESLEVSSDILWQILGQEDYLAMDKKVLVNGEELSVRVIRYSLNAWEQVNTDKGELKKNGFLYNAGMTINIFLKR